MIPNHISRSIQLGAQVRRSHVCLTGLIDGIKKQT